MAPVDAPDFRGAGRIITGAIEVDAFSNIARFTGLSTGAFNSLAAAPPNTFFANLYGVTGPLRPFAALEIAGLNLSYSTSLNNGPFPEVVDEGPQVVGTAVTSSSIPLFANILVGDRIVVGTYHNVASQVVTTPTGFTLRGTVTTTNGIVKIFERIWTATGNPNGNFTLATSIASSALVYLWQIRYSHPTQALELVSQLQNSVTTTNDLPILIPSWGTANTLYGVFIGIEDDAGPPNITAFPGGLDRSSQTQIVSATASIDGAIGWGWTQQRVNSADFNAFTYGPARSGAFAFAVPPAVSGAFDWDGMNFRVNGADANIRRNANFLSTTSIIPITAVDDFPNDETELKWERAALTGAITAAQNSNTTVFASAVAKSALVNATNAAGVPAFLAGTAANQYLRVNSANTGLEWGVLPAGGGTGWDDVLLVDPHSGASNPIVDDAQYLQFGIAAPPATGQIRTNEPFQINGDDKIEIFANDLIHVKGPDTITIESTGGSPVHLLTSSTVHLESTASQVTLEASTFVDVTNGFMRFGTEQAASTPVMSAGQSLLWPKNTATPGTEPFWTDDNNNDFPLFLSISENGAAPLNNFSRINFDDGTKILVTVADLGSRQANVIYSINPGSLPVTDLAAIAAKSVIANATNASAIPTALAGSAAFQHLRVNSANTGLEWSVLTAGDFPAAVVPLTALATQATDTFVANVTAGTASPTAVNISTLAGAGLVFGTHTIDVTAGAGASLVVGANDIQRGALTGAITATQDSNTTAFGVLAAKSVLANATNASAVPAALAGSAAFQHLRVNSANTALEWSILTAGDFPAGVVPLTGLATQAAHTFVANNTAGVASPTAITATAATAELDVFSTVKGLVPGVTSSTTNFLRADGTFAVPPGTGAGTGLQFVTYGAEATLSNERVTTGSTTIAIDVSVASQIAFTLGALTGAITSSANSLTTAFGALAAKSVLANATNAAAVPAALAGSAAFQHLRVNSANTALEWSVLTTGDFPANAVPVTALATIATDTVLANITAGTATPTAVGFLTIASTSIVWDATTHTFQLGAASGGDITRSQNSVTYTISNNAVTYAKMQDVSATSRFIGRITAGAGDPEELTGTQATSLLNVFTSTLNGLAPLSGGGTANFLRADGTWTAPPGASPAHVIQDNSTSRTARANLNFDSTTSIVAAVTDDSVNNQSDVTMQRAALTGAVTAAQNSNATAFGTLAALSVLANATNAVAIPAALAGSAAFQHLRVNAAGTALEWSVFTAGDFPAAVVPLTGHATQATDTFVANVSGSTASPTAVNISTLAGAGLVFGTHTLDVTAGAGASLVVGANDIQRGALTGAVTASQDSNTTAFGVLAAKSVLANATNASAVPAALAGSAAFQHLRVNSGNTALEWSVLTSGDFPAAVVPLTGIATQATDTFVANVSGSTASPTAVNISTLAGAGLVFGTHTLDVTAGAGASLVVGANDIQRGALTGAVTATQDSNTTAFGVLAAKSVLANATNASAVPAALAGSAAFQHLRVNSANTALEWSILTAGDFPAAVVPLTGLATQSAHTFVANNTAGVASPTAISATAATAELDLFSSTLKGLTPLSGGGTVNFLRADGTWTAPTATLVSQAQGTVLGRTILSGTGTPVALTGAQQGENIRYTTVVDDITSSGTITTYAIADGTTMARFSAGVVAPVIRGATIPSVDGQRFTAHVNTGAGVVVTFLHESGSAAATTNRFRCPGSVDLILEENDSAVFEYTNGRWRCIAVSSKRLADMTQGTQKGRSVLSGTGEPIDLTGAQQGENIRFDTVVSDNASTGTITTYALTVDTTDIQFGAGVGAMIIRGFTATGMNGKRITFLMGNGTGTTCTFNHEDLSALGSSNRLTLPGTLPLVLRPGEAAVFEYSGTSLRWKCVSISKLGVEVNDGGVLQGTANSLNFNDGAEVQIDTSLSTGIFTVTPRFEPLQGRFVTWVEDFMHAPATGGSVTTTGTTAWVADTGASLLATVTGSFAVVATIAGHPGILNIGTSGTINSWCGWHRGEAGTMIAGRVMANNLGTFQAIVRLPAITSLALSIGISTDGFNGAPNSALAFTFNSASSALWQCLVRSAATGANVSSGVTLAANTWYNLKITLNAGTVNFFINGTLVSGPTTTNVPTTSSMIVHVSVNTLTAAARGIDIDMVSFRSSDLTSLR